ncbi:MAG TPA: type III pantothenate kinase [Actinomycetes bacterium]|nr:type III pantothenate kinase [Actinomycetes bacterium]
MLLTIDIGNTQTVLGLFNGDNLEHTWRIATYDTRTADELAVLITSLIAQYPNADGSGSSVTGVALCSTVPAALHEMRLMCTRYYDDVPVVVVEPGVRTGVPILTDNPKEVGSDRIINALAAATQFGGPAIVVDFGTATTFDAVSPKGEYLGGAIAPGIEISVEALGARGAQLRKVELARPRSVVGRNTVEALQSGILFGFAGQVDGIVHRMAAELADDPDEVTVIATGGLAPLVLEEAETIDAHDPWLTLRGLKLVFERNTE